MLAGVRSEHFKCQPRRSIRSSCSGQRHTTGTREINAAVPTLVDLRDVLEHFDDYLEMKGNLQHPRTPPRKRKPDAAIDPWEERKRKCRAPPGSFGFWAARQADDDLLIGAGELELRVDVAIRAARDMADAILVHRPDSLEANGPPSRPRHPPRAPLLGLALLVALPEILDAAEHAPAGVQLFDIAAATTRADHGGMLRPPAKGGGDPARRLLGDAAALRAPGSELVQVVRFAVRRSPSLALTVVWPIGAAAAVVGLAQNLQFVGFSA